MSENTVYIYDTTLRDGEQSEGISYSLKDKIKVAKTLDEFGIDYIEGGWPGSNPKAVAFFEEMKGIKLKKSKLSAFGSTRHAKNKADEDDNLIALIEAKTPAVAIFGKTWDLHVTDALRVDFDTNLKMINDSIAFLKEKGKEVIYDAEHFFDGYKSNPEYALKTLQAALEGGADTLCLCDTNGGSMVSEISKIMGEVKKAFPDANIGIHTHNDSGMAVANALMAVYCGANHVQGTINGFGERCGNADLIQVIPSLVLKYKKHCKSGDKLKELTKLAHYISEISNMVPDPRQPYVGRMVFTHKGGIHVSAVIRNPKTYEHIDPELVGNQRRVLVSELSGKSNIQIKSEEFGIDFEKLGSESQRLLKEIKRMENEGYQLEAAEGSFEVMLRKAIGKYIPFFDLIGFRVIVEKHGPKDPCLSEATIKLKIGDNLRHEAAEGDGPVNALDSALRKALERDYPEINKIRLSDYKVRVVDPEEATAAHVRVLINSTDGKREWGTVGVSENIIEASWQALVDSVEYHFLKRQDKKKTEKE